MTTWSDSQTSVVDGCIFESVPESRAAGRISEARAAVLVRHDFRADLGCFDDDKALHDTRISISQ